ncbi:MAG: MBL fold metallo-hydrolase [Saprospiraceae bacterium]|nr:MBL fold metallo-hydrolase [Saprospiraceae bacterium]
MIIKFLGTGTSQGIPVLGCTCATCSSEDARDKRLRTSAYVEFEGLRILIDTGPDLRQQLISNHIFDLDAILFTHEHNDHTAGLDDVRPINFLQQKSIPAYGLDRVMKDLKVRYNYIFGQNHYPGSPKVEAHIIDPLQSFAIRNVVIQPLQIIHSDLPILGFRIGRMAYITDVSFIPQETAIQLNDLDVLVISALQFHPHHAHFSLNETLAAASLIGAKNTYLIHMSHSMGPVAEWTKLLPSGVFAAHDGLTLTV